MTCTFTFQSDTSPVFFDWYQASFPEGSALGAREALTVLGDTLTPARPSHGFGWSFDLMRDGFRLCNLSGGSGRRDHVRASGSDAPEIAAALRRLVPGHSVSRVDAAVDFDQGPEFFEESRSLLVGTFGQSVTVGETYSQAPGQPRATTLYLGSPKSEVRTRLYEKGKQAPGDYSPHTVRLECQVRPSKPSRKAHAATATPEAVWGFSRFSSKALDLMTGLAPPAAPARSRRVTDLDGSIDAMCAQYGARMVELLTERHGGDLSGFAADLFARIEAPQTDTARKFLARIGGESEQST